MSRDENWVLSSEDSSCPDEPGLELSLALSIGNGPVSKARILTAEDFPSSDVSSSSSPSVAAGTKRTADSAANGGGQVVGWPPVGAYRMNSFTNQPKPQPTDEIKNGAVEKKTDDDEDSDDVSARAKDRPRIRSSFVKVNMDGSAIGRKVDPSAHASYETLAQTLEDMFLSRPSMTTTASSNSSTQERSGRSKLLDGSSGFALTYEDRDGDWMLVGDVPWRMFLDSVKRLRIMRTCESNRWTEKQAFR